MRWLTGGKSPPQDTTDITCTELFQAAQEYQVRNLCFWICVDMVANAMGRCEVRTFQNHREIFGREYYTWNYEPNVNQNSTAFLHKLVAKLYQDNEVLVVPTRRRDGAEALVVADAFQIPYDYPSRQNEYTGVTVGDLTYDKTFRESEVLHLRLNHNNMRQVLDGLYASYWRLVSAAMRDYQWGKGQHWKVHVSQLAQGTDDFTAKFSQMIQEQVKPFLESNGAILPEFDGYLYEKVESSGGASDTRDIRALIEDIFDFTARGFLIPAVLVNGSIEGTADANTRFLTNCIDPLADQLQEEITRKRYGFENWRQGNFVRVDTSSIIHFDLFANAANVEKLVGSGAYTINDVRRAGNQSTINEPWADEHYMTLNISTMDEAARPLDAQEGGTTE